MKVATKPVSKASRVREYLESHPSATNKEIVKATRISYASVAKAKSDMSKKTKAAKAPPRTAETVAPLVTKWKRVQQRSPLRIFVDVVDNDVEVKLLRAERMLCTVSMTAQGIRYRRANAKAPATRLLTWDNLDKLMASGLLG